MLHNRYDIRSLRRYITFSLDETRDLADQGRSKGSAIFCYRQLAGGAPVFNSLDYIQALPGKNFRRRKLKILLHQRWLSR